jgi:hypothetical protein
MQQHALLQRVENVFSGYLLRGRLRLWGGVVAVTRCRVGRGWWSVNEFDEEPTVLPVVRVSYSFVSITAEGQDSSGGRQYFESNHAHV